MTTRIFSEQIKIHHGNSEIRMVFKIGFPLILLTNCIFTYWIMKAYDFNKHYCAVLQMCLTLWPMDCSPPGSSVHGILQATLKWVALPSSRGSSQPRNWTHTSGMLLHCWQVLYPLSHLGSPTSTISKVINWCFSLRHQKSALIIF